MKGIKLKRKTAGFLAAVLLLTPIFTYLPSDIFNSWAFNLKFVNSGLAGHPYLLGTTPDGIESMFLCMNPGASAHSNYDYTKVNADINYNDGTLEQKRLFWAYIGAFGSYDKNPALNNVFGECSSDVARDVAWSKGKSNGGSAWVETMANDGFLSMKNIPEGCKSPKEILELISKYNASNKAMYVNDLRSGPGQIDTKKLYELTGLSDWDTFKRYCTIEAITPGMVINTEGQNLSWSFPNVPAGQKPAEAVMKISYDPTVFRVLEVTGTLEYFQCKVAGSQQLYRAKGNVEEKKCEFFLTTKYSGTASPTPEKPSDAELSLKIYQHNETFESHYKVDLEKRDYETGNPLKDSTWQVLEQFDNGQLSEDESDGGIIEDKMRENPTTWQDWLVFDDDLVTDANGHLSYGDTRYYDFGHSYCNGHPIPPEPEEEEGGEGEEGEEGEGDDEEDEYEQLMEQWQEAVDECEANAAASGGTFHHWLCDSEEEPSVEEAFENSGCKAARDAAYENFINLQYDYTFRETKPRDGYIKHDPGHPDDVPIEIITTASSEAERGKKWKSASNSDINVTGYARNRTEGVSDEDDKASISGFSQIETGKMAKANFLSDSLLRESKILFDQNNNDVASSSDSTEDGDLILKETYDLPLGEKVINKLLKFIGLPAAFTEEKEMTVKLIAPDDDSQLLFNQDLDEVQEGTLDGYLTDDDIDLASTPSQAKSNFFNYPVSSLLAHADSENYELATSSIATPSIAASLMQNKIENISFNFASEDTNEEEVMTSMLRSSGSSSNFESGEEDGQPEVEKGPADNTAHTFKVFDHRVPGQVHFNKRDLQLRNGESAKYNSYGDTQGDSTLEGAVYGLFAADAIYGPDTQRDENGDVKSGIGIVFDANDLVSVAATDKNGEGSFLTITERPHSFYNYKTGKIEYNGKSYSENLYIKNAFEKAYSQEEKGRIYKDNKSMNGDSWIGRPLFLGNYYIKELTRSEGYELSITGKDMEVTNVSAETRSEYGNTNDSKTAPVGTAWITKQLYNAVTFPEGNASYGNKENLLLLETKSKDAMNGYNVVIDGVPEDAELYFNNVSLKPVTIREVNGGDWVNATEAPFYQTATSDSIYKRDINGNMIEKPGVTPTIKVPYEDTGVEANKLPAEGTATASDPAKFTSQFSASDSNVKYVKAELEQMMRNSLHMETPKDGDYSTIDVPVYDEQRVVNGKTVYGKPEMVLEIENVTTNKSLIEAILNYYVNEKVFTYGSLQNVEFANGKAKVTIVVGMTPQRTLLYQTNSSGDIIAAYLTKLNTTYGRYVIRKYTGQELNAAEIGSTGKYIINVIPDYEVGDDGIPTDKTMYPTDSQRYLRYTTGDTLYDYWYLNNGSYIGHSPVTRKVWQPNYKDVIVNEEQVNSSKITKVDSMEEVADPVGSTYYYYDGNAKQYTIHVGSKDMDLTGVKTGNFTIALKNGKSTVSSGDISKIGANNVWGYKSGDSISNAEYVIRISGAGAGAFSSAAFDTNKTYIKNQRLIYNGYHDLLEDGNTIQNPTPVVERAITQKIKVTKDIDKDSYVNTNSYSENHEDWFTRVFGGFIKKSDQAKKMDNFRFKTYLKSNLERIYRDNNGEILWQNKDGLMIDILETNKNYPALVNKIYTNALHVTDPLFKNSEDAVVKNQELYSYTNDFINDSQNQGYTSVLETTKNQIPDGGGTRTVESYNYEKFFDGIAVANNDKWDDGKPTYTSWQPIGNQANRTGNAIENAKVSDMVRQFAIKWYLDDEVNKLVKVVPNNQNEKEAKNANVSYTDEVYDEALHNAIVKSENYLKPFFSYNLDEIYAIEWDSEENGGADKDKTTLSADTQHGAVEDSGDGYYFGLSQYLPYGTYVVVEQQPKYAALGDFKNKHYQIDKPREVILPTVYANYDASQAEPEVTNSYYNYSAAITQPEMESKYKIRFNEEPLNIIKGRNADGDFEVYKYGMDIDNIRNGVLTGNAGDYFSLTQSEYKPYKNYYNAEDNRSTGNIPYYLSEGLTGKDPVSKYYRYSSVSEQSGMSDNVAYQELSGNGLTEIKYKDHVPSLTGAQTAYNGKYASMLVPWGILSPVDAAAEVQDSTLGGNGESSYKGYDYVKFHNKLFTSKLRIEKLDSETHENILHDGALFNIYAAERDDSPNGDGTVKFYDVDTEIKGTKEFLEAMGAKDIKEIKQHYSIIDKILGKEVDTEKLYQGIVSAGTPICNESEKIVLGDNVGTQTVAFKTYSTVLDGLMKDEATNTSLKYQNQTVGYLETPQPLSAGVYVVCEAKAPSGYVKIKPIAVEVYSDEITYYKEANRDKRVVAAVYEYETANQPVNNIKPKDNINVARINVENVPIKLTVEKLKESSSTSAETTNDKTVTYKVSGRVDGTLAEIGNNENLEYAYDENGVYLGYAWKKGTLETLAARQRAGEKVQIVYEGNIFAGYGYVTKSLETADDTNKYVVGATMTLYDAIQIESSGDTEDHSYNGLVIERTGSNNVSRMYVKKDFAGEKIEFIKEKDEKGNEYVIDYQAGVDKDGNPIISSGNIWTAQTIQRPDTDILYFDLDNLEIFTKKSISGKTIAYGYDKNHNKIPIEQIESDKVNYNRTDTEHSIYAFKDGKPYLEFVGGDFNKISYSKTDKVITVGTGTVVYHIDREGNRDSMVDPYTGMAYVKEAAGDQIEGKILVWAVNIHKDEYGNIISKDKIKTSRIGTIGENKDGYNEAGTIEVINNSGFPIANQDKPSYNHTESGYISGSWGSAHGEESHKEVTKDTNKNGNNMNDSALINENNGSFQKKLNPVYDNHGLPEYYQRSNETYDKGADLYDRNNDFVRYQDSDNLDSYNQAAYKINEQEELRDGDVTKENQTQKALYHRQGEGYILENTWKTSDKTPNDPFDTNVTNGQADILKRLPAGKYIMEELISPKGYTKGMPSGFSVNESAQMQNAKMVDKTTKIEISKIDGTDKRIFNVINMDTKLSEGTVEEGKGSYQYGQVKNAIIALYAAKKVYTTDYLTYPKGYYLVKESENASPITYYSTDSTINAIKELTARWTTDSTSIYIEGIPEGYYLLEEIKTPSGFVTSRPVEVYVGNTAEVQPVEMNDDHTKVEVGKYEIVDNGNAKQILPGAEFTLYKGNEDGSYNKTDSVATWVSDDATDFTETINLKNYPNTNGENKMSGFITNFETLFRAVGTTPGTSFGWAVERKAIRNAAADNVWNLDNGIRVNVINGVINYPSGMSQEDRDGFLAAYDASGGNKSIIKWVDNKTATYVSHTQIDSATTNGIDMTTKFPTSATMYFKTNSDETVKIEIGQTSGSLGETIYNFDYKFDYKKLNGINDYACSYLTSQGHRRFDYLPAGENFVLVETKVPEGYAKAADRIIKVADSVDVQYYQVINESTALRISKVAAGLSGELTGAKLGLFKAGADGSLNLSSENLITTWITGEDGNYTDNDFVNGLIPNGYKKGDLKPHTIRALDNGIYYVTELSAPAFYKAFQPVKIDYKGSDEIKIIRTVDDPVTGKLEINKIDKNDKPLVGVTFEVKGYSSNGDIVVNKNVSDTNGRVELSDLPVGEQQNDGTIIPYTYKVREIYPPEGYAVDSQIRTFQFSKDKNGVSYSYEDFATATYKVINEKTRVSIEKRSFSDLKDDSIKGAFVTGAVLAVYELNGKDDKDAYIYDESSPVEKWTTKSSESHVIEGLIAGRSYLLKELKAPVGYNIMKPVVFTVTVNGRSINSITNELSTVTINQIQKDSNILDTDNLDIDSIESLTIKGRYVSKVEVVVTDAAGNTKLSWTSTGGNYTITNDILEEGETFTFTEYTYYSDGSKVVTNKMTKRAEFNEEGKLEIPTRSADKAQLSIYHSDGSLIDEFAPNDIIAESNIKNNINPQIPKITLKNRNSENGDAINPHQAVIGTISYVNTSYLKSDITVTAQIDKNMSILETNNGTVSGNTITWQLKDVEPRVSGYVTFVGEIKDISKLFTSVTGTVEFNGNIKVDTKAVPVLQANNLTVYNELEGSGKEIYSDEESSFIVRLYSETGEELKGSYAYDGSKKGVVKSGEVIALKGNEFITLNPGKIYKNVNYNVERIRNNGKLFTERYINGKITNDNGAFVTFSRSVKDTADREKFAKLESYVLVENTFYDNGSSRESNKIQFTINENGSISTIAAYDKESHVVLRKTDITTGDELPGAKLLIEDQDGIVIDKWISTKTPHEIVKTLIPGQKYTLREIASPEGYGLSKDVEFEVNEEGAIDTVIMEDKPTHVKVRKTDITTGVELPGTHMAVKTMQGDIVDEWISTAESHDIVKKLIAGETYKLVEINPSVGYAFAAAIDFTVSMDGRIDVVEMEDRKTQVEISKLDITTNQDIPNAELAIKNKSGEIVEKWVSNGAPHILTGKLIAGEEYILTELKPPMGYGFCEDIKFTVSLDGSIDKVYVKDKKTEVIISKVDLVSGIELPGATLAVKNKEGVVIEKWVSSDTPHVIRGILNAGEKYILTEISSPKGYQIASDLEFDVNRNGEIMTVVMKDAKTPPDGEKKIVKYPVTITKMDVEEEYISGAEYGIYKPDGTLVQSKVTDSEGKATFMVEPGKYYLQEISAPTGYAVSPIKYDIIVSNNGDVEGKTEVKDDYARVAISKLDISTFEPLIGAEFTMFTLDGTPIAYAKSGDDGYAEFSKILYGEYYIMETGAPDGYEVSPEQRFVTVNKFYTNAAPIFWYNAPDTFHLRPRTGDDSPIVPVIGILLTSMLGYGILSIKRRKDGKK